MATSAPDPNHEVETELTNYDQAHDMSVVCVKRSASAPVLVSDGSIADLEQTLYKLCKCSLKPRPSYAKESSRRVAGVKKQSAGENSPNLQSLNQSPRNNSATAPLLEPSNKSPRIVVLEQSPCTSVTNKNRSPRSNPSIQNRVSEQYSAANQTSKFFKREVSLDGSPCGQCFAANQTEAREVRCDCDVQELYFNAAVKSDSSGVGNVKKEVANHSCGRIVKESAGTCSLGDSASGSCDAARAHYYHNKLLSTLQILQNKEETIRVQAESLSVAEGRIAALGARADQLRRQLDRKTKKCLTLQMMIDSSRVEKTDASIMADTQETEDSSTIVNTLQTNLSIIEELYRECFYETAKQESLIELLRQSCLDVRRAEKDKDAGRARRDRFRDIAVEVESLKTEISNFLNNSSANNDSGVWESRWEAPAPAPPDCGPELRHVAEQLLRLRDMLADGCICGLQEENMRLKQSNETMENKINELQRAVGELEAALLNKDHLDITLKDEIERKENELHGIRQQLMTLEEGSLDQNTACDTLAVQLKQAEVLLEDKAAELAELQNKCAAQETTIRELKEEMKTAENIAKENASVRGEVSQLSAQVSRWRAQLSSADRRVRALEHELRHARAHAAHLDACYSQQADSAAQLQTQLAEAQARGAALCGQARRAVAGVRLWLRRMAERHREQQAVINEKEELLASLQERLRERQCENATGCSKCACSRNNRTRAVSIDTRPRCPGAEPRKDNNKLYTSGSEMASCSSAPVPPRRLLRKKSWAEKRCECGARPAEPARQRDESPTEQLTLRVERLASALADGTRRWARRDPR